MIFKLNHPLISESHHFDSWTVLCEYVVETAELEAQRRLYQRMIKLTSEIADEIIETAEEIDVPFER